MVGVILDIEPENYFILHDGRVLKDLNDLLSALRNMDDYIFYYHANHEKNDFANWIREVIHERDLAKDIEKSKSKSQMVRILNSFLKNNLNRPYEERVIYRFLERTKIMDRMDEIIRREREIEKREDKIQELELEIENRLREYKSKEVRFSLKAFFFGILAGLMAGILVGLSSFVVF